jgi:hypothetical protein
MPLLVRSGSGKQKGDVRPEQVGKLRVEFKPAKCSSWVCSFVRLECRSSAPALTVASTTP